MKFDICLFSVCCQTCRHPKQSCCFRLLVSLPQGFLDTSTTFRIKFKLKWLSVSRLLMCFETFDVHLGKKDADNAKRCWLRMKWRWFHWCWRYEPFKNNRNLVLRNSVKSTRDSLRLFPSDGSKKWSGHPKALTVTFQKVNSPAAHTVGYCSEFDPFP